MSVDGNLKFYTFRLDQFEKNLLKNIYLWFIYWNIYYDVSTILVVIIRLNFLSKQFLKFQLRSSFKDLEKELTVG